MAATVLIALAEEGTGLLRAERDAFMSGRFAALPTLLDRKQALLFEIEETIPQVRRTAPVVEALQALIAEGRRNEEIIRAARVGVGAARRTLRQIARTQRGAVAYAEDGGLITSKADAAGKTRQA